ARPRGVGMSCPQVNYRLAADGDRHRRTNLTLPCEVPGKGLAHPPEARITHAADSNISGSFDHHSSPLDALGERYRRESVRTGRSGLVNRMVA
ncbi:MAG TPA: hypothetical protein VGJ54_03510, partial [Streptosporangiaceae bacterium]